MATELGALDVVFRAVGANTVLGAFKTIDAAGAKSAAAAKGAGTASASMLRMLGQRYRALSVAVKEAHAAQGSVSPQLRNMIGQQVEYARSIGASNATIAKWTALHATASGAAQQTTAATRQAAAAMGAIGAAGTTAATGATAAAGAMAGAGRASTTAAAGMGRAARAIQAAGASSAAGIEAISRRIALLSTQMQAAGTRTAALTRLTAAEAQLTRTLQFGNTTFMQRIRLERELARVRTALAGRAVGVTGRGGGILAGIGTVVGISAAFAGYRKMTDATDELRNSQEKLRATAKITGTALDGLVATAAVGFDEFKLSAAQANNLSIEMAKLAAKAGDISQATPALRAFLDLGAARGLDAEKTLLAVRQAILGIDEGTDKLFNANPSVLYKRYADAIGKSAGALTDQEKAQAILNAALEDGGKVRGQFQTWLQTTAGLSAQQATEVTKSAEAFGKAIDPIRRLFLEFFTGAAKVIGQHATLVAAFFAIAGAVTAITFAVKGLIAVRWAALWASMMVNPILTASLIALSGIVLLLGKRWLDTRLEMSKFREEMGLLSDASRKFKLRELQSELAIAQVELANERRRTNAARAALGVVGIGPAVDIVTGQKRRDLEREVKVLHEKVEVLKEIPASAGGTKPDSGGGDTGSRDERIKALGEEVGVLTELAALGALNRDDIARALELERVLNAELAKGNTTREQRVEIEQRLLALREAGLSLAPQEIVDNRPGGTQKIVIAPVVEVEMAEPTITALEEQFGDILDYVNRQAPEVSAGLSRALERAFEFHGDVTEGFVAFAERVKGAAQNLEQQFGTLGLDLGMAIATSLSAGIAGAMTGENPLKAFGQQLLAGFGSIMQQLGAALIEYGIIMTGLLPALMSVFTSGPAAIAAGIALTALGGAFSGAFSGRGGGRGSRASGAGGFADTRNVIPAGSRFTREERQQGISRTLPSGVQGGAPSPRQANNYHFTIIGENDPRAQRSIMNIVDSANARGLSRRRA